MRAFVATLLLAGVGDGVVASRDVDAQQPVKPIAVIQPESRFEFSMVTRWNQVLIGRFPEAEGDVLALPVGRRQVRIPLASDQSRGDDIVVILRLPARLTGEMLEHGL